MENPSSQGQTNQGLAPALLKANAFRLAGSPEFRKRFFRSLPILGDIYNVGAYLTDSDEPSLEQRIRNAAIIGGGGALASMLTGGVDAIPAVAEALGIVGENLNFPKTPLDPVFQAAPVLNVENYLQEYAYSMDPNKEIPEGEDRLRRFKKVFSDLQELENMKRDFQRIYGGN